MSYLEIKIFFHKLVDCEKKLVTFPLFNSFLRFSRSDPWIVKSCALTKVEMNPFLSITWSDDQWVTWLGGWDTLILNHKGYIVRATELNNKSIYVLQIGATLFYYKLGQLHYYKLGQVLLKIGQLLQIRATVITK